VAVRYALGAPLRPLVVTNIYNDPVPTQSIYERASGICTNNIYQSKETVIKLSIKHFRLPFSNKSLLEKWISTIGEQNIKISKFATVCSKHFHESCFDKTGQTTRLYQDAYPTLFLGGNLNEEIIEPFKDEEESIGLYFCSNCNTCKYVLHRTCHSVVY
jgi:hypothetical protein